MHWFGNPKALSFAIETRGMLNAIMMINWHIQERHVGEISVCWQVPIVASNRIGTEKFSASEITFYGGSFITDNKGAIVEQVALCRECLCFSCTWNAQHRLGFTGLEMATSGRAISVYLKMVSSQGPNLCLLSTSIVEAGSHPSLDLKL